MSPPLDTTSAYSQPSYSDDVNDEIRAARESLRLLKSKMSSNKTPNTFSPSFETKPSFGSSSSSRHKASADTLGGGGHSNYRKAFKPTFAAPTADSLDQYIENKPPRAPPSRTHKSAAPSRAAASKKPWEPRTDTEDDGGYAQAPVSSIPKRQTSFQSKRATPHRPSYEQEPSLYSEESKSSSSHQSKSYQPSRGKPKRSFPQPTPPPAAYPDDPPLPARNELPVGRSQQPMSMYPDEMPPEDAPAGPTKPCPSCGRTFAEPAYSKHIRICEKVFMKKAKKFDMAKHRAQDGEQL